MPLILKGKNQGVVFTKTLPTPCTEVNARCLQQHRRSKVFTKGTKAHIVWPFGKFW